MSVDKKTLFQQIADAVVEMEEDTVEELANQSLDAEIDAYETIDQGLAKGVQHGIMPGASVREYSNAGTPTNLRSPCPQEIHSPSRAVYHYVGQCQSM